MPRPVVERSTHTASRLRQRRGQAHRTPTGDGRPPALWRSFAAGVAAVAAAGLIAGVLVTLELGVAALVAPVLCGLALLAVTAPEGMAPAFLGLLIVSGAGLYVAGGEDYPLFGSTVRDISVKVAGATPAAAYYFTDGEVRADLEIDVGVRDGLYQRRALTYGLVFVAPLVPAGWTPDAPVPAWVVSERGATQGRRTAWAQPYHAAARVAAVDTAEIAAAIAAAQGDDGLVSAPNAPIVHWAPDPTAAMGAEWMRLAQTVGWRSALWGVVLLGARLVKSFRG